MKFKDIIAQSFLCICVLCTIGGAIRTCTKDTKLMSTPVEEMSISKLNLDNNKFIIEVYNVNTIKDVDSIVIVGVEDDIRLTFLYGGAR